MAVNKVAAAYLAYGAYIDDALDIVQAGDFEEYLQKVPSGAANGPWDLTWGPNVNNGILAYIAQGADGSYGLAFRGTNTDTSVPGAFENFAVDLEAFNYVPWLYPQNANPAMALSAGANQALALAIGMTDPTTDFSLLDKLRELAASEPLELLVAGHSLGGVLTVAASAWLYNQLPKAGTVKNCSIWPHTFAAPTVWNPAFASWFQNTFSNQYYAAINSNDIVPMAWNNLSAILGTFSPPGPNLWQTKLTLWLAIDGARCVIQENIIPPYTAIPPTDLFSAPLEADVNWVQEAGWMHSMQYQYFLHATGTVAPPLPNTSTSGVARSRAAAPR